MLKDISNKKVDIVIVKDLSRLGRNYIEVGELLDSILPLYDVKLISINDNIDGLNDEKVQDNRQAFGDRDGWKDNKLINTFTMEEVKAYLKRYKILKLNEIEYTRESDNKKWHFYNIIAKKEVI